MARPSDYEYRSEQDPGDARVNQLAQEDWEHYLSDRGKLFFRRLKPRAESAVADPAREFFGEAKGRGKKAK